MPVFSYKPRTFNDPSSLPDGLHPAFCVAVTDEETPDDWAMKEKSPRMWRWYFAVWDNPNVINSALPELQSTVSSQTFSSGGKYQASKAFVFACSLLNRQIQRGEKINIDELLPLPCQLYTTKRNKQGETVDGCIIKDLTPWADGTQRLSPELKARLHAWWTAKHAPGNGTDAGGEPNPIPPASQPQWAQPAQSTQPPQPPAAQPQSPATPNW